MRAPRRATFPARGPGFPVVSTRQSITVRPLIERLARTDGRAAGGIQVTIDREEGPSHGIPGGKAVKRCLDRAGSARNEPVAIVLMPSRRDHFPETPARVGQSCRKLSMSGSSGASLAIRCDKTARVSPTPKGGAAGVCSLTRGNLAARYADCARLVDQPDKKGWQKLDGSPCGQVHGG